VEYLGGGVSVTITSGLKPVLGTAQATTSGTLKDFTDIPSWVKRITIMFNEVSGSGTSETLVQIGSSGGLETTGYVSSGNRLPNASSGQVVSSTAGFLVNDDDAGFLLTGHMVLTLMDPDNNTWISSHEGKVNTLQTVSGGGSKSLSGALDRVRITYVNGTDTFDAGSINVMYE
jgi:hypothetical protein